MTRFLRLSSVIINISKIIKINIDKNKYIITVDKTTTSGFIFIGVGELNSELCDINICANKNPVDYKIVSDWIKCINA